MSIVVEHNDTIYLRDMVHFKATNEVSDAWVDDGFEPARACVEGKMARDIHPLENNMTRNATALMRFIVALILCSGLMTGCSDEDQSPVVPSITPEIISVSPETEAILTGEFQLSVTAEETESMSLLMDGNLISTLEESPWNWTIFPRTMATGDHEFTFIAMAGDKQATFTRWIGTTNGDTPLVGMPAPDFRLVDAEGNYVLFSELRGNRPVLLNFWAAWCPPCREELPLLQTVQETYGARGLLVLTVDTEDNTDNGYQMLQDGGYTFDALYDMHQRVQWSMYREYVLPTNLLIGRDGVVFKRGIGLFTGYISDADIEAVLVER